MKRFFGPGSPFGERPRTERDLGSGVIVSADGYIVTNYHLVEDAVSIRVPCNSQAMISGLARENDWGGRGEPPPDVAGFVQRCPGIRTHVQQFGENGATPCNRACCVPFHRVMRSVTRFITQRLKLNVNEAKSAVARPQERKFLGFTFTGGPEIRRAIAPKALTRFKDRIREITRQAKGVSIETTVKRIATYMVG